MKLLMRADTHVSLSVPAEEPKAKVCLSQVTDTVLFYTRYSLEKRCKFCSFETYANFPEKSENFMKSCVHPTEIFLPHCSNYRSLKKCV